MSVRARGYCITSYDLTLLEKLPVLVEGQKLRYACGQVEVCPSTGKKHFQGYVEFPTPRTASSAKDVIGVRTLHIERRLGKAIYCLCCFALSHYHAGSREQARAYATKEDTRSEGPFHWGQWDAGGQGSRSDLEEVKNKLKRGASVADIAEEHFASWVCRA